MFQSSSDPKAGCDGGGPSPRAAPSRFNPHPTRRPDATRPNGAIFGVGWGFNPHPTRRPDATRDHWWSRVTRRTQFQSSSDPKAGCDRLSSPALSYGGLTFQSSSDPKAGCDSPAATREATPRQAFQSSSDPKAGCDVGPRDEDVYIRHVSILIRPEGRMRP